jgi:hypothetical protein
MYWPEVWKRVIAINVPALFVPVITTVKSFATNSERDKIVPFGSNKAEWQPYVLNFFDPEQLPPRYGGTRAN